MGIFFGDQAINPGTRISQINEQVQGENDFKKIKYLHLTAIRTKISECHGDISQHFLYLFGEGA